MEHVVPYLPSLIMQDIWLVLSVSTGDENYWEHQARSTNCNVQCHISSTDGSSCTSYSHQTNRNPGIHHVSCNLMYACYFTLTLTSAKGKFWNLSSYQRVCCKSIDFCNEAV